MPVSLEEKAAEKALPINENAIDPDDEGGISQGNEHGPGVLWRNRHLVAMMVKRDAIGKYKGSLLGALWPLINPVGHLILYTFLFCFILNVKFNNTSGMGNFALYLMSGLLPWGAFSEAVSRSSTIILENPNLVKRVVFPLPVLPMVAVLSPLITEAMAFWHANRGHCLCHAHCTSHPHLRASDSRLAGLAYLWYRLPALQSRCLY